MKKFKDLKFEKRFGGVLAKEMFDNGFEISVVASEFSYSTPKEDDLDSSQFSSFEVAILNGTGDFATRDFVPDAVGDVLGWQSREEIDELMLILQK